MQLNNEEGGVGKKSVIIWPFPLFHFSLLPFYSDAQPSCSSLFAPAVPSVFSNLCWDSAGGPGAPPMHCYAALGLPPLNQTVQRAATDESVSQPRVGTPLGQHCVWLRAVTPGPAIVSAP